MQFHAKAQRRKENWRLGETLKINYMTENYLSKIIVDTCYRIHIELGPGLFESVYEEVLAHELIQQDLVVSRQQAIP